MPQFMIELFGTSDIWNHAKPNHEQFLNVLFNPHPPPSHRILGPLLLERLENVNFRAFQNHILIADKAKILLGLTSLNSASIFAVCKFFEKNIVPIALAF